VNFPVPFSGNKKSTIPSRNVRIADNSGIQLVRYTAAMLKCFRFIAPSSKYSLIRATVAILISSVSCQASGALSYDWNGVWQLDPAKSHIYGPTLRISMSPDGVYHNTGRIGTRTLIATAKGTS
jgi:hypothetical protein